MLIPLLLAVASLPFFVLGIGTAGWFCFALADDWKSRRWPQVVGRITESRVVGNTSPANPRGRGLPGWHWKVHYSYTIPEDVPIPAYDDSSVDIEPDELGDELPPDPDDRNADGVETSRFRYRSRRAAERLAARFTPGQDVQVSFDPTFPGNQSTIRPGFSADLAYPVSLSAAFTSLGVLLARWAILAVNA